MKEIAVLNGELNGIHDTLSGLKTQLCAYPPCPQPTTRHSRRNLSARNRWPCPPPPAVLADMAASEATSTWRRRPLELVEPGIVIECCVKSRGVTITGGATGLRARQTSTVETSRPQKTVRVYWRARGGWGAGGGLSGACRTLSATE